MKKYFAGLLAVAFAVVCFAFTKPFAEGPSCNTQLYYFEVDPAVGNQTCNQIAQSELLTVVDADSDSTPDEVTFDLASNEPFGCTDVEFACALGYNSSQLERVFDGSNFVWRPKSTEVQNFKCCVYKPEQP